MSTDIPPCSTEPLPEQQPLPKQDENPIQHNKEPEKQQPLSQCLSKTNSMTNLHPSSEHKLNNSSNNALSNLQSPIKKITPHHEPSTSTSKRVTSQNNYNKNFSTPLSIITNGTIKDNINNTNNNINCTHVTSIQIYKNKLPLNTKQQHYYSTNTSFISSKIKESQQTAKDKRKYHDKVEALKKRINALKKQKEEYDKKHQWYEKKNKESEQIKQDKKKLQEKIIKVEKQKQKEIETKKQKAARNKSQNKTNIDKHNRDSLEHKRKNYSSSVNARKQADITSLNIKQQLIEHNQKQHAKAKEHQRMFKEEENKRLLSKEQEITNYYTRKVEENEKESKMLKDELDELEKIEKTIWKQLKDSQKKADDVNRISVNKIKDPHRIMLYKETNGSILTRRSTNERKLRKKSLDIKALRCVTPKPFIVKKTGFDDSFCNLHQSKITPKTGHKNK